MVKLNKIYTKTGDGGTAGLVDGSRVSKASLRMAAIGEIDEANAAIGLAIAMLGDGEMSRRLRLIQNELFDLGADAATPGEVEGALRIVASQVERLEGEIDAEPGSAMFTVDGDELTGVAVALFADGITAAELTGDELVEHQGRMTVRVTTCGGRRSARD